MLKLLLWNGTPLGHAYTIIICVVYIVSGVLPGDKVAAGRLEADGFPAIGTFLQEGDPLYRYRRVTFIFKNIPLLYSEKSWGQKAGWMIGVDVVLINARVYLDVCTFSSFLH
jgi:hypothetical protein